MVKGFAITMFYFFSTLSEALDNWMKLFCSVGDPFKDTAGPSIHVLIKMLATITLVMAPVFL